MITQGPFDLTLNAVLPLNDPGANSNNPATAVQIQNASPFIVEVNSGGSVLTIQSFTAQTVATSGGGQQMSITPIETNIAGATTAPNSLTVVWLLAGESAPMPDGALTAAAITAAIAGALSTQSVVDQLTPVGGTALNLTPGTPTGIIVPSTALHAYDTLLVIISTGTAVVPGAVFTVAAFRNSGLNALAWWPSQTQEIAASAFGPQGFAQFTLPCGYVTGDTITVEIEQSITGTSTLFVFGISAVETSQVIAPKGMPLASYQVGGTEKVSAVLGSAGTSVILAAPPAGLQYRLQRLTSSDGAVNSALFGVTSGFVYGSAGPAPAAAADNLDGLLASESLEVVTGGAVTAYLFYDLVPVQTLQ